MTKRIDEQVVLMEFDNRNFEKNVNATIQSTEKLKNSLDFKGVDKGFKNIDHAASNVNMSTLEKSVESVRAKFSAMEVVAVTALANITNSAINAGKNLVKSLSIDQITAGMNKYEQKTASVQTIMNATGKSIDEVNKYLEKLMWFSDETSYGFTDMTAALGQMTSSGGDVDNLIPLITGVANATAYAGKGAAEFSRVMYNLNQSYGAGYLQLMDWKSLELAGVGSKQLKQTFIDTAVAMGKIKEGEVTIANFSETLKDKWADTEVMESAFGVFGDFTEKVHQLKEDIESGNLSGYSEEIQKLAEAGELETTADMMEALSEGYEGVGKKAFQSAQEAKSFTEAIDATKDAVSSQWMETFELIFGNYEQAKVLWTELCNNLWDIFASGGESRNELLRKALSYSPLSQFSEKLEKITETIKGPVKKLQEYEEIVNRIIGGEFGNGQARWDKLTEAGYDWAHAQNLVNEKLGDSTRHATNFTEELAKQTEQTVELTDAKLKELGLTEEEIKMYRELEAESKKTGKSIDELIESMEEADGRTLLLGGFKNIGSGIIGVIYAIRDAFNEIFPPMTALQLYNLIKKFNEFTENLRLTDKATGELNETGDKLKRTFQGVFAIFDIILTIVGGPLKLVFKAVTTILGKFGLGILDVTANVGDAIVRFRDWLDSVLDFNKVFDYLAKAFKPAVNNVKEWIKSFKDLPIIQNSIQKLKDVFSGGFSMGPVTTAFTKLWEILVAVAKGIKSCYDAFISLPTVQNGLAKLSGVFDKIFGGLKNALTGINFNSVIDGINNLFNTLKSWISGFGDDGMGGEHLMSGLANAISGAVSTVINAITNICTAIYNAFTSFFGIHSPSTVFFTLGKFCIAGLVAGLLFAKEDTKAAMGELGASLISGAQAVIDSIVGVIKDLDLGTIFAATGIFGIYKLATKTLSVIELFGKGVEGFGSMCKSAGGVMDAIKERINPKKTKFEEIADSVLKLAGSIAILAGAVYILAQLDSDKLWNGVKAIAALAGICVGLAIAAKLLKGADGSFAKLAGGLILMSIAIAVLGLAMSKLMKSIGDMDGSTLDQATEYLVGFGAFVLGLTAIAKFGNGGSVKGLFGLFAGISLAMLAMAKTLQIIGGMDKAELDQAKWFLIGFAGVLVTLALISKLAGGTVIKGLGGLFAGLAAVLLSMAICVKMLGGLDENTLIQGAAVVGAFMVFMMGFVAIVGIACNSAEIAGMAGLFFGVSMALLAMAACIKILGGLDSSQLEQGMRCVREFAVLIGLLILVSKVGSNAKGLAATLLAISVALAVMAGVVVVLGMIPESILDKGLTVVAGVGLILAALIAVSKLAEKSAGAIWGITAMLAVVTASILVLSHIDPDPLYTAVTALGVVITVITLALAASKLAANSMGSIIVMSVLVAVLGGVLYALSTLPADQVIASAASLAGLLAVVAGVFVVLGLFGSLLSTALMGVVGLLAICVPLLAFVGILYLMQGIENATSSVIALSIMLGVMTVVLIALSVVGALIAPALLGVVGLLALCVPLLAIVGVLYLMEGVENATSSITALSTMLGIMTAMLVVLGLVGVLIPGAMLAVLGLGALVVELGLVIAAIGALAQIPGLEWLISEGGDFLQKIGTAIGQFVGGIVGGFTEGTLSTLPTIAIHLSQFMANLTPFIEGSKSFDSSLIDNISNLAKALLTLTGANIVDSLTAWITGGSSITEFGEQLVELGSYMADFSSNLGSDFNPDSVVAASKAAKALAVMADTIPSDWGNNNITNFGDQIVPFAEDIKAFSDGCADIEIGNIETATKAVGMLSDMADTIPSDFGNNNLTNFGDQLTELSSQLIAFGNDIGLNSGVINQAIASINSFITSLSEIDASAATTAVSTLNNSMKEIALNAVTSFGDVFSSAETQSTVKTNMGGMLTAVSSTENYTDQYTAFVAVGKYMVEGFAKGITDNTFIAQAKAKAMAEAALTAARTQLDVNSPSKKFMEVGKFVVEGFARGIKKNTKTVTEAARTMSTDVLKATQDELEINSPSIVFDEKVGRYIVEGIAEGIKKNTSAEEAARMKAQNIVSAFQTEINKLDLENSIASSMYDAWVYGEGRSASDSDKHSKEVEFRTDEIGRNEKAVKYYYDMWQEAIAYHEKGEIEYEAVLEAKDKYWAAVKTTNQNRAELQDIINNDTQRTLETSIKGLKDSIEHRDTEYELAKELLGPNATDAELDALEKAHLRETLIDQREIVELEKQQWEDLQERLKNGTATVEEVAAAKAEYDRAQTDLAKTENDIAVIEKRESRRKFENIDERMETRDAEHELAIASLGPNASEEQLDALERSHLQDDLKDLNEQVKIEEKRWEDLLTAYSHGEATLEEVNEAYKDFLATKTEAAETQNKISQLDEKDIDRQRENLDKRVEYADNKRELAEAQLGIYASEEQIDALEREHLNEELSYLNDQVELEFKEWQRLKEAYENGTATLEQLNEQEDRYIVSLTNRQQNQNQISQLNQNAVDRELSNLDNIMGYADTYTELLKAQLGIYASDDAIDSLDLSNLNDKLPYLRQQEEIKRREWLKLRNELAKGNTTVEIVEAAYYEFVNAQLNIANAINESAQIQEDAAKRQHEALEKQYEFAADNADTLYKIWEKTEGRKATGVEKDVKKLSVLSEQLFDESALLKLAREEWDDAKRKYGRSSTEAQEAYNNYLKKQLDIANLQSEITDINEKNVARQKVAASEYKDYIKKYEKYYELNGMSKEDLERDAKLISGYDPNSTVNNILTNTKNALDNINENDDYTAVVNGFSSLGKSYVTAVNDGVNETTNSLTVSFLKMSSDCISKLEDDIERWETVGGKCLEGFISGITERPSSFNSSFLLLSADCIIELKKNIERWKSIGKMCVEGFVSGIETNIYLAAQAAASMAQAAMEAAKAEFDINSPSRAFADIGMFAVMGLAQGLTDNAYLSNAAASYLGKTAIDNLRETIRHISDAVDSDVDSQPTIRPVLDLSDVESKARSLNAMFSTSQAMGISASMSDRNRVDESQNGNDNAKSGNTYEFNQYNYSPKALSRADIYRQTKNQFAAMKGELR